MFLKKEIKVHTFYYEDEDEYLEEQQKEKENELLNKKRNLSIDKNDEEQENEKKLTPENKQLINTFKQRKKHIKQLEQISQGLQEQKELLKGGKKKKIGDGVYKYFMERKK